MAAVATASLGKTPTVSEFFQRVDQFLQEVPQEQPENKILGTTYTALPNAKGPENSIQAQAVAYKAMKECANVYEAGAPSVSSECAC